jgi:hypothetical protein
MMKKMTSASLPLTNHNWGVTADFNSHVCDKLITGTAAANNVWPGSTTINPGWHTGGIIDTNQTVNMPTRYAEISCLHCDEQISIPIFLSLTGSACFVAVCPKCQRRFMVHDTICHDECDCKLSCLGIGIFINLHKYPIIDLKTIREPEPKWIVDIPIVVNVQYLIPQDIYIIQSEISYGELKPIQNDWLTGDPFQLPNVSKW